MASHSVIEAQKLHCFDRQPVPPSYGCRSDGPAGRVPQSSALKMETPAWSDNRGNRWRVASGLHHSKVMAIRLLRGTLQQNRLGSRVTRRRRSDVKRPEASFLGACSHAGVSGLVIA
jgi:hypothetical protein